MKLRGFTDPEDWHLLTLIGMALNRQCWYVCWEWRDWRFGTAYDWYDGPMFTVWLGPLWVSIAD